MAPIPIAETSKSLAVSVIRHLALPALYQAASMKNQKDEDHMIE